MKSYFINLNKDLNSDIFEFKKGKYILKNDVRKKLLKIYKFVLNYLNIPSSIIDDVILTGSNASYNYTNTSDIDLHIVYNLEKYDENTSDIYEKWLKTNGSLLNLKFKIKIKNKPVEIYFQNIKEKHIANGIYSVLKNKWIKFPEKNIMKSNSKLDHDVILKVKKKIEMINNVIKKHGCNDYKNLKKVFDNIKNMRKKKLTDPEKIYSVENLAFKYLRSKGIIDKLAKCMNLAVQKELSL